MISSDRTGYIMMCLPSSTHIHIMLATPKTTALLFLLLFSTSTSASCAHYLLLNSFSTPGPTIDTYWEVLFHTYDFAHADARPSRSKVVESRNLLQSYLTYPIRIIENKLSTLIFSLHCDLGLQ